MKIIRVFPRKTNATPDDENVRINSLPNLFDEADEIHIDCTFTWDRNRAEELFREWSVVAPAKIGGVAYKAYGEDFIPGMYLKKGHLITSRGCPNKCWFCQAWRNEGDIRELPIYDGYIIHDNNLLATSEKHQEKVFNMLLRQKEKPRFTGGFEAKRFTEYHKKWLEKLKPKTIWFAYDTSADYEPLAEVGRMYDFKNPSNKKCCYVLIGYKNDTIEKAETRLWNVVKLGFFPQAMLYNRRPDKEWRRFQREWANRVIVGSKVSQFKRRI